MFLPPFCIAHFLPFLPLFFGSTPNSLIFSFLEKVTILNNHIHKSQSCHARRVGCRSTADYLPLCVCLSVCCCQDCCVIMCLCRRRVRSVGMLRFVICREICLRQKTATRKK